MANHNLVIEDAFRIIDDGFYVWCILYMSVSYSRNACDIICDLFIRVNIGVQFAFSILIHERYSGQKLFLVAFDELTINRDELVMFFIFRFGLFRSIWGICKEFLPVT